MLKYSPNSFTITALIFHLKQEALPRNTAVTEAVWEPLPYE
jgi:hypothetical protein